LTDRVKIDMICKISLMCQKVSHKTKVQHSVNNKPRAPLTGLRDPIIKRGRVMKKQTKKPMPPLFGLLSTFERTVERWGLSIHLAHNTQTVQGK